MSDLSSSKTTKRSNYGADIGSLPTDLWIDILARVASTSFTDLFNAKLSCRDFLKASNDKFIMKNISVEKFPAIPWCEVKDEITSFLEACKESGNSELIYRQGMMKFFSEKEVESGEEHLKRAMEMGKMEALYIYGIILFCRGGESNQEQGIKLLNAVKKSRKLEECRKRTRDFILSMWVRNPIVKPQELTINCHAEACGGRNNGDWSWPDHGNLKDGNCCEFCMWDDEVSLFCKLFR